MCVCEREREREKQKGKKIFLNGIFLKQIFFLRNYTRFFNDTYKEGICNEKLIPKQTFVQRLFKIFCSKTVAFLVYL